MVRVVGALVFASVAFQPISTSALLAIYILTASTDLADGFLARRWQQATFFGSIIDILSDKALTIVSLLYAAEHGIAFFPLAVIATREAVVLGMRAVVIDGRPVLATSRLFGAVLAIVLWGNTAALIALHSTPKQHLIEAVYWACAAAYAINLALRLHYASDRIRQGLRQR